MAHLDLLLGEDDFVLLSVIVCFDLNALQAPWSDGLLISSFQNFMDFPVAVVFIN